MGGESECVALFNAPPRCSLGLPQVRMGRGEVPSSWSGGWMKGRWPLQMGRPLGELGVIGRLPRAPETEGCPSSVCLKAETEARV